MLHANAQRNYSAFDILNDSIVVPPNGILIADNVFLDDSEVMNVHYLEYLHFLVQDSSEQAVINAYPDTTIFGTKHLNHLLKHKEHYYKKRGNKHIPLGELRHDEQKHEPAKKHHWWNYFSYNGTRYNPVVGISYEQALAYCKWRSRFVTNIFNKSLQNKLKYNKLDDKYIEFEFSLPTEEDWSKACKNENSESEINYQLLKTESDTNEHPVAAFDNKPNKFGFYNLIGNVAEMTSKKGIAKGGSFYQTIEECNPTNNIIYSKPERWLGFRCVCKVTIKTISKP
jgi:formylglycine-generating enzyme required for sulfatase activity